MTQPAQVRRTRTWPAVVLFLLAMLFVPALRDVALTILGFAAGVFGMALLLVGGRGR